MKVEIILSNIFSLSKEKHIFNDYDENMFPTIKGLTHDIMFKYWSKIFKEEKNIDYKPSYFDMNENFGIIYEINEKL